jgi:hypothetical protein
MPLYPFLELEAGSAFRVPTFRNYTLVNPPKWVHLGTWECVRVHKNRIVDLKPRLDHVKETTHDMLNMPMNEFRPMWPLQQLLYLQELVELKAIKHRYHLWKDY